MRDESSQDLEGGNSGENLSLNERHDDHDHDEKEERRREEVTWKRMDDQPDKQGTDVLALSVSPSVPLESRGAFRR